MEQITNFNFEGLNVRTLKINNEPWFVGKDVANILGYQDSFGALKKHVDLEDKQNCQNNSFESNRGLTIINESGLYSLILSSKLESAKRFKRWVTSEVLPALRKTGTYKVPTSPAEALKLMFEVQEETNKKVEDLEERVISLEDDAYLNPSQYNYLNRVVKNRIVEVRNEYNWNELNKQQVSSLYQSIGHDLNYIIGVHTRSQIRIKDFDKAIDFIKFWEPSSVTKAKLQELGE